MKTLALFIGLDKYKETRIPPLAGCVNDIERFEKYLKKVQPAAQIVKLKDKEATKAAIVSAFQTHLSKAESEDTVIIYFAGHGIRQHANAVLKSDAMNDKLECITCYDTALNGTGMIADKELRYLIRQIADNSGGAHIVTIFDCCHSGDNTRDVNNESTLQARFVKDTERGGEYIMPERKWADFIFSKDISEADFKNNEIASLLPQGTHIQLAACANNETAKEQGGHGFFSTYLLELLESSNGKMSYYDLRSLIYRRLQTFPPHNRQTPQFYAVNSSLHQPFLGGSVSSEVRATVSFSKDRNRWEMSMGDIYGIYKGAKVFVNLPNGQTEAANVDQVLQDCSVLSFDIEGFEKDKPEAQKRIQRSQNYTCNVGKFQQQEIKVACASKTAAAAWDKFCKDSPATLETAMVKPVAADKADYVLNTEGGQIFIARPNAPARPLVEMLRFDDKKADFAPIFEQLHAASRWEFVKNQKSAAANDKLFDGISLSFERPSGVTDLSKSSKIVCPVTGYDPTKTAGIYRWNEQLSLKITNNSSQTLYIAGAWLSEFFGIDTSIINANAIASPVEAGKSAYVYKEKFRLTFQENVFTDKWDAFSNFLKIYASPAPFEIHQLQQADLEAPRKAQRTVEATKRGAMMEEEEEAAPMPTWAVKTVEIVLDVSKLKKV
jgi:hypothetical protein